MSTSNKETINQEEVVKKRKKLFSMATKQHTFNVGDRRVHTPRVCSVCSRPLSRLVMQEQTYVTTTRHIRIHIGKQVQVNMCSDIRSCYRNIDKERG